MPFSCLMGCSNGVGRWGDRHRLGVCDIGGRECRRSAARAAQQQQDMSTRRVWHDIEGVIPGALLILRGDASFLKARLRNE